jgi:hypothetical protein
MTTMMCVCVCVYAAINDGQECGWDDDVKKTNDRQFDEDNTNARIYYRLICWIHYESLIVSERISIHLTNFQ